MIVSACRASNPARRPSLSWAGQTLRSVDDTTRSSAEPAAAATTAARADSAPESASAIPAARWTAATRTTAVSGTAVADPWPVTVTVRGMPARLSAGAGQTRTFNAEKISSVALDRLSV